MTAQIAFNDGAVHIGSYDGGLLTTIVVSNVDNTGVLGWAWELLDVPVGSAAVLSSTTAAAPTFTADIRGTYFLRLTTYTDAGRTILDGFDEQVYAIRLAGVYNWRVPAAGEARELSTTRGWAIALDDVIRDINTFMTAGAGPTLWKWNETDAAEFTVALDEIGGATPVALSKVTGVHGPALRLTWAAKVTGEKLTVLSIASAIAAHASIANLRRYVLEFEIVGFSGVDTEWYAIGPAIACNALQNASFYGVFLGFGVATGGFARTCVANAGVVEVSSETPGHPLVSFIATEILPARSTTIVRMIHTGAARPEWQVLARLDVPNDAAPPVHRIATRTELEDDASITALGVAWNTQVLSRCGIGILGNTGTTAGQWIEIANIRITKHPMDI